MRQGRFASGLIAVFVPPKNVPPKEKRAMAWWG